MKQNKTKKAQALHCAEIRQGKQHSTDKAVKSPDCATKTINQKSNDQRLFQIIHLQTHHRIVIN